MELDNAAVRQTWRFLGALAIFETALIAVQWPVVMRALELRAADISLVAWIAALVVAIAFIVVSARRLDLTPYLLNVSPFRVLGPIIAIPSSIIEEAVFRMTVMNLIAHAGGGVLVQIIVSAITFGAIHAVWAVRGGRRAAIGAVTATTILGAALAIVFVLSGRALLPCVVAHFVINIVLEPWLGYAFALRSREATALA